MLDVENGQVRLKHRVSTAPTVHMSWVEEAADRGWSALSSLYAPSSAPRSYHEPSLPSAVPCLAHSRPSLADQAGPSESPEHLSLLCVADAAATVSLHAFGSFPLAAVNVWPVGRRRDRQQAKVLHVRRTACLFQHACNDCRAKEAPAMNSWIPDVLMLCACRQRFSRTSCNCAPSAILAALVRAGSPSWYIEIAMVSHTHL